MSGNAVGDTTAPSPFRHTSSVPLPGVNVSLDVFCHARSGLRIGFCALPGPIVDATIVIPTEPISNAGHPHTLEHLIFMGSERHPTRGFLDKLAARSLSTGSNAQTAEDYTSYQISTAGHEGMERTLPALLDHVLRPTLSPAAFLSEVCSVDLATNTYKGVVFCEMEGRQHTEGDLLENAIRSSLYPNSGYAFDAGGLTHDICKLTNSDIVAFHRRCYRTENCTVLVFGQCERERLLRSIDSLLATFREPPAAPDMAYAADAFRQPWAQMPPALTAPVAKTIYFPSKDEDFGSVGFAWRGLGPWSDVRTAVIADCLLAYLAGNEASPLYQEFVECRHPISSSIETAVRVYMDMCMIVVFAGAPTPALSSSSTSSASSRSSSDVSDDSSETSAASSGPESEAESGSESAMSDGDSQDEEEDEEGEEVSEDGADYLQLGVIKHRLLSVIQKIISDGFPEGPDIMKHIVRREKMKLLESLESDPVECLQDVLCSEVIFAARTQALGSRLAAVHASLEELETTEGDAFWRDHLQRLFLDNRQQFVEIVSRPSSTMKVEGPIPPPPAAATPTAAEEHATATAAAAATAVAAVIVQQQQQQHQHLPAIPDLSKIPELVVVESRAAAEGCLSVSLPTSFIHANLLFDISALASSHPPYLDFLYLFESLLFASDFRQQRYQTVVRQLQQDLVSYSAVTGIGAAYPQLFVLSFTAEESHLDRLTFWMANIVDGVRFDDVERIRSCATTLHSQLVEQSRDGDFVQSAAMEVLTAGSSAHQSERWKKAQSVWNQMRVLKPLMKDPAFAVAPLRGIRQFLLEEAPRMMQVGANPSWQLGEISKRMSGAVRAGPFARGHVLFDQGLEPHYAVIGADHPPPFGRHCKFVVGVGGVESSFVEMVRGSACGLRKTDAEYFPLMVACEVMSLSEGPLFEEIRGRGLAYDARIGFSRDSGLLSLSLHECSNVLEALAVLGNGDHVFGRCSEVFMTDDNILNAKSSLIYQQQASRCTPVGVLRKSLRGLLHGAPSYEADISLDQRVFSVSREAVVAAAKKYLEPFLQRGFDGSYIVVCCGPEAAKKLVEADASFRLTTVRELQAAFFSSGTPGLHSVNTSHRF